MNICCTRYYKNPLRSTSTFDHLAEPARGRLVRRPTCSPGPDALLPARRPEPRTLMPTSRLAPAQPLPAPPSPRRGKANVVEWPPRPLDSPARPRLLLPLPGSLTPVRSASSPFTEPPGALPPVGPEVPAAVKLFPTAARPASPLSDLDSHGVLA